MLDHVSIVVADFDRAKAFYTAALAPLGYALQMEFGKAAGFGRHGKPSFWIGAAGEGHPEFWSASHRAGAAPIHVAFVAESRADVDAFYRAAIEAGARDFGAPGPRPHYHPDYYGAFVLDADGNNVEAVCHKPA